MEVAAEPRESLLVRAIRGEAVERTPVWAMRQAGRWDPEFQKLRGNRTFYEFSENAELAAAASLCPRRFGVDAIILFYDITTLAVAMGQPFDLVAGRGPVPRKPIRTVADVERLASDPDPDDYPYLMDLMRIVRRELDGSLPILVFAGAPFTLATYQIGTGKSMDATRQFIRDQPETWQALLDKTSRATVSFVQHLLRAGAAAYQIFDSWAGGLSEEEYRRHAHPHHQRLFQEIDGRSILFVKDNPHIDLAATSGATMLSLSTGDDLRRLRLDYPKLAFQGNVDHQLLVTGSPAEVAAATRACLEAGEGRRHVLNLDHGMDRDATIPNFEAFIQTAREFRPR